MDISAKLVIFFSFAFLAILIFYSPEVQEEIEIEEIDEVNQSGISLIPGTANVSDGQFYLTYNTPWIFQPPVEHILPTKGSKYGECENCK